MSYLLPWKPTCVSRRFYKEAHLTILYIYLSNGTEQGTSWHSYPQPAPAPPVRVVLLREPSLVPLRVDNQALQKTKTLV